MDDGIKLDAPQQPRDIEARMTELETVVTEQLGRIEKKLDAILEAEESEEFKAWSKAFDKKQAVINKSISSLNVELAELETALRPPRKRKK